MASYFSYLETLPARVFEDILLFLDVLDLGRLTRVSRSLRDFICKDDILWKFHCKSIWLLEELSPNAGTWYQQWLSMANSDWWPYRDCYAKVKGSWETIESVLASRCPSAYEEVVSSKGATVQEIEQVEKKFGTVLPKDYKCSLRIHGQQRIHLGSVKFYHYRTKYHLLGVSDVFPFELDGSINNREGSQPREGSARRRESLLVLARNTQSVKDLEPFSELLVISNSNIDSSCIAPKGLVRTVYYRIAHLLQSMKVLWISEHALSFSNWLQQEAVNIKSYHVTTVDRHLTRFTVQPTSTATTDHFTVTVGVSFDPSFGQWQHLHYYNHSGYGYHIVIAMSPEASQDESCRLLSRHWDLDQRLGVVVTRQVVDGDGVVGNFPTFHPGETFEYASYTTVEGDHLTMSGYFVMEYLNRPHQFKIAVPPFSMLRRSFTDFISTN